jgi:hypothetical protein
MRTGDTNGEVFDMEGFSCPMNARGNCEACGLPLGAKVYRLPKLAGLFCSIACIETEIFGGPHCRWCGAKMEKAYVSIDSRLCSEDCRQNYNAHVLSDGMAILGSGVRLLLWLKHTQPALYRKVTNHEETVGRSCANPRCPNGENGNPSTLDHLRAGTVYCSESCKKQSQRSPNRHFSRSKKAAFIEFSRDAIA